MESFSLNSGCICPSDDLHDEESYNAYSMDNVIRYGALTIPSPKVYQQKCIERKSKMFLFLTRPKDAVQGKTKKFPQLRMTRNEPTTKSAQRKALLKKSKIVTTLSSKTHVQSKIPGRIGNTAYLLFLEEFKEKYPNLKQEFIGMCAVSKWNSLSIGEQQIYKSKARVKVTIARLLNDEDEHIRIIPRNIYFKKCNRDLPSVSVIDYETLSKASSDKAENINKLLRQSGNNMADYNNNQTNMKYSILKVGGSLSNNKIIVTRSQGGLITGQAKTGIRALSGNILTE